MDGNGRVVGVNVAIISGAESIGFADRATTEPGGVRGQNAIPGLLPAPFMAPDAGERRARLAGRFPARARALEAACQLAPDPDQALAGAERYADAAGSLPAEDDLLEALALLCGASRRSPRSSPAPPASCTAPPVPRVFCGPAARRSCAASSPAPRRRSTRTTWRASTACCAACAPARWCASPCATCASRP